MSRGESRALGALCPAAGWHFDPASDLGLLCAVPSALLTPSALSFVTYPSPIYTRTKTRKYISLPCQQRDTTSSDVLHDLASLLQPLLLRRPQVCGAGAGGRQGGAPTAREAQPRGCPLETPCPPPGRRGHLAFCPRLSTFQQTYVCVSNGSCCQT